MFDPAGAKPHKLDPAGRLKLREEELQDLGRTIIAAPGFDGCITLFTTQAWEQFVRDFEQLSRQDPSAHDLRRLLIGPAERLELDAQDRVKMPEFLLRWAGLGGGNLEAFLIRVGEGRWECWEAGSYHAFLRSRQDELKQIAGGFFGRGTQPPEGAGQVS